MNDIVERLRSEQPFCRTCADLRQYAAEEIKRLQFVLEAFREALKTSR
jgi:hypothetical protein